ncbi:hypothetical protein E4U43_001488 [Claviceps pusilla]|uniref:Uncharacterized protein n=1 Tax=Claviceps pusilla TaxID=123648 RepID=A0A9P7NI50_9HYPO|nr:hypothetical protein E4U43_001488 [Claviceps pusilla]
MASFSRGFSLLSSRPLAAPRSVGPVRFFTSSLARLRTTPPALAPSPSQVIKSAKQTTVSRPPSSASPKPAAAGTVVSPSRYAFIKSLTSKQTPTILYEAPSHFWFYFGCWSSGIAILGWTALTGPTVIQQPEGIPQWVAVVFGASYMLLGAMGFYIISKTPNIVSTIRVLPPVSAASGKSITTAAAPTAITTSAAAVAAAAQPQLEVTVKRMVPFLQPKIITTQLDNVSLKSRFSLPDEYVPELKRLELRQQQEQQRKALHRFDMQHLLTMPFRRLGRALVGMFRGVRAAWTDMGFGAIKVDGKFYKVDVTKGFAHDGFRTLEQLVHVGFK